MIFIASVEWRHSFFVWYYSSHLQLTTEYNRKSAPPGSQHLRADTVAVVGASLYLLVMTMHNFNNLNCYRVVYDTFVIILLESLLVATLSRERMKRLTMAITLAMLAPGCAYKQTQSGQEHVTGDIKAAKSSTWDLPYYPVKAQAGRIEGVVRASYTVDTKGCAENIKIISAQPADVFERETIRAMNKWCGMEPTSLPKIITITFRLNGGASMEEVPLTVDK